MEGGQCRPQFMGRDQSASLDLPHPVIHLDRSEDHAAPLAPGASILPSDRRDLREVLGIVQLFSPSRFAIHDIASEFSLDQTRL